MKVLGYWTTDAQNANVNKSCKESKLYTFLIKLFFIDTGNSINEFVSISLSKDILIYQKVKKIYFKIN